ncbi:hypothetical protein AX16_002279 [Volvariella volvacea WC 439]|nr:hypothetical protein AX16_002279 [Volvariella volvacea WC 439]
MPLTSGIYTIKNQDKPVGRYFVEDLSLLPKRVLLLPDRIPEIPRWIVEDKGNKSYILRALGAPTGKYKDSVYAFLIQEEDAEKWRVEPVEHLGPNKYIITTNDGSGGWVAPEETENSIAVRPLIVGPSFPPFYPPNEVFEFIRLDRD